MANPYKNTITIDMKTNPTKDVPGRHEVINLERRNHIERTVTLGEVTKLRGVGGYNAFVLRESGALEQVGEFDTKHQAGHAVKKEFYAAEYTEKEAKKAARIAEKAAKLLAKQAPVVVVDSTVTESTETNETETNEQAA